MKRERVDLYGSYRHFTDPVLDAVRQETFGTDIGQNSWVTVDEYERLLPSLETGTGMGFAPKRPGGVARCSLRLGGREPCAN